MDRKIGDVEDARIANAKELKIYCYAQNQFATFNKERIPIGRCQICPKAWKVKQQKHTRCTFKTDSWSKFKKHLRKTERIYGQLVAFPVRTPVQNVKIYEAVQKFRNYGELIKYKEQQIFYLYNFDINDFEITNRDELHDKYFKNNLCDYCGCNIKISHPSVLLKHIASLERRYYAYLILDSVKQEEIPGNKLKCNEMKKALDEKRLEFNDLDTVYTGCTGMSNMTHCTVKSARDMMDDLGSDVLSNQGAPSIVVDEQNIDDDLLNNNLNSNPKDNLQLINQLLNIFQDQQKEIVKLSERNYKAIDVLNKLKKSINENSSPLIKSIIDSQIWFSSYKFEHDHHLFTRTVTANNLLASVQQEPTTSNNYTLTIRLKRSADQKTIQSVTDSDLGSLARIESADFVENLQNEIKSFKRTQTSRGYQYVKSIEVDVSAFRPLFTKFKIINCTEVVKIDLILEVISNMRSNTNLPTRANRTQTYYNHQNNTAPMYSNATQHVRSNIPQTVDYNQRQYTYVNNGPITRNSTDKNRYNEDKRNQENRSSAERRESERKSPNRSRRSRDPSRERRERNSSRDRRSYRSSTPRKSSGISQRNSPYYRR